MHWCDAGGGFGVRGELYPGDILVAYLARLLGRRGKWTDDRSMRALGSDVVLDEGDYPGLLERAMTESGYLSWVQEARERRCASRLVGTGMAVFLEKSGLGPYEVAEVQVDHAGRVQVTVGGTSLGQGIETVLAQIAADVLGVRLDIFFNDTATTEMLGDGVG